MEPQVSESLSKLKVRLIHGLSTSSTIGEPVYILQKEERKGS